MISKPPFLLGGNNSNIILDGVQIKAVINCYQASGYCIVALVSDCLLFGPIASMAFFVLLDQIRAGMIYFRFISILEVFAIFIYCY